MTQAVEGSVIPVPEPVLKGTFALYALADGSRVLAYRPEGDTESTQIAIPAFILKMMERSERGEKVSPMEMIKAMMGHQG